MPIANAKVEIYKDSILITTGYTDSYGKFTYPLDVGDYKIIISKEGYQTVTKEETVSTRTQLIVNLPSLTVAVTTDALGVITLVKDYFTTVTEKVSPITLTKDTTIGVTDKEMSPTTTYETEVA